MNRSEIARLRPLERKALLDEISAMVLEGELRLGEAVRVLRRAVLGMDRPTFARAVKLSPRALALLEDAPDANPTLDTLRKVFAPFGGRIGLVFSGRAESPPLDEEHRRRRDEIRTALASAQRRRRKGTSG